MNPRDLIYAKIVDLARGLGQDATTLAFDQKIPGTGYLDSAAIMELILWLEAQFNLEIPQEDLTLSNLGTIDAIADYVRRAGGNPERTDS
jgi:acyl carrier protein